MARVKLTELSVQLSMRMSGGGTTARVQQGTAVRTEREDGEDGSEDRVRTESEDGSEEGE